METPEASAPGEVTSLDFNNPISSSATASGKAPASPSPEEAPVSPATPQGAPEPATPAPTAKDARSGAQPTGKPDQAKEEGAPPASPLEEWGYQQKDGKWVLVDETSDDYGGRVYYAGKDPQDALASVVKGVREKQRLIAAQKAQLAQQAQALEEAQRAIYNYSSRIPEEQLDQWSVERFFNEEMEQRLKAAGMEGVKSPDQIADAEKRAKFEKIKDDAMVEARARKRIEDMYRERQFQEYGEKEKESYRRAHDWYTGHVTQENLGIVNEEEVAAMNKFLRQETGIQDENGKPVILGQALFDVAMNGSPQLAAFFLEGIRSTFSKTYTGSRPAQPEPPAPRPEERVYSNANPPPAPPAPQHRINPRTAGPLDLLRAGAAAQARAARR